MKKIYSTLLLIFAITTSFAQIPEGYYDSATGTGETLKTQLFNIISSHTNIGYDGLWELYKFSDIDTYYENDGTILDMYSEDPTGTDPYNYTPGGDQCGNYSGEGSCYNREHSFPKSWFNDANPMYSDAFHIYPTDGKVNGQRSNYPYGEVDNPSWTSQTGSKLGPCSYPGYTETVFEPIDEFKGDLARTYFYMATCYEDKIDGWSSAVLNGTSYPCYTTWFINMLLDWNAQDPVSQREIDRNNAIYYGDSNGNYAQGNRNPFIDHPEWAECIWNNNCAGSVEDPANLSAVGVTTSEIDLTWDLNTNSDDILLAYNTTNTFGTPSGTYNSGDAISGGGTVLIAGNTTSFNHTGLSPQTYYYKIWSYDGTDYSSGITTSATPLIGEPTNHVTNFTLINAGATTIDLSWTDATGSITPSGYLIKANLSGSAITPPVDGQPEADATFVKNISAGIEAVTFSGLNPNTSYDFEIFPYTNSSTNIDYKTDGTIPSVTGTTTDTPIEIINEDFTTCPSNDWTIYSVASNKDWECGTNSDMYVNGYNGDVASNDWFISPVINLNDYSNEVLTFDTYTKYSDSGISDPEVKLMYSVNYSGSGDPTSATWTEIAYTFPSENSQTWTASEDIDLSGINGTDVYLAFHYASSGTSGGSAALWELDNIILTGILSSGGNTLPEFTSTPITTATAGQAYTYNITATDADAGDVLTFTAPVKPVWLTLTDNGDGTASLTGTPSNSDAGDNAVSLNVSDGTDIISQNFSIDVTSTESINSYKESELKIFPNPTKNSVNITSSSTIKTVELRNILGKTVLIKQNLNIRSIKLDINSLSEGIYLLKITFSDNKSTLNKLIIE